MSGKKLLPEEELEKQYRDYKAQFEQWKEKNKGSEGTDGYIKYVKDFENWEKEVEQRRISIRTKAEQEKKQSSERSAQMEDQQPQDEASVAARYAREQQQYTAMHMRGIQDQERQQAIQRQKHQPQPVNQSFNAVPPPEQQHLFQMSRHDQGIVPLMSLSTQRPEQFDSANLMDDSVRNGPRIRAEAQPSTAQQVIASEETRPLLWGSDGAEYLQTDIMFKKWGVHALPPNIKAGYRPPINAPITPCWYLMKKMEEKGLFYGHNVNLFGVPDIIEQQQTSNGQAPAKEPTVPPVELDPQRQPQNGVPESNGAPKVNLADFSQLPAFDPSRPPPQMLTQQPGQQAPFNSSFNASVPVSTVEPIQFNVPPPVPSFRMATTAIFKKIRYGTALKPTLNSRICAQFPSRAQTALIDPGTLAQGTRPFSLSPWGPRHETPSTTTGYPSVSTLIGCTDNLDQLYKWQLRTMHQIGVDGFNTFMVNRMASGRVFHSIVQWFLEELLTTGRIESTVEDALNKHKSGEKYTESLIGYLSGIREYLRELKPNPLTRLEKSTYHPILCYTGRFDAIVEIDGELTLVDWKTINASSAKSSTQTEKLASDLYSNPTQIAAYVAAVNSDPAYSFMPTIRRAAVVLTYEDGRGVEIVQMGEEDIEQYFDDLCRRVNKFWWTIENGEERGGAIDFVYNPVLAGLEQKESKPEDPAPT